MKKLIAFLGVLAMLLTMVSGISFAEGDTIKIGTIYVTSCRATTPAIHRPVSPKQSV